MEIIMQCLLIKMDKSILTNLENKRNTKKHIKYNKNKNLCKIWDQR